MAGRVAFQGVNCDKPAIKTQLKSLAESAKVYTSRQYRCITQSIAVGYLHMQIAEVALVGTCLPLRPYESQY